MWFKTENDEGDTVVNMKQFQNENFDVKELLDGNLWVIYKKNLDYPDCKEFLFARFHSEGDELYLMSVMHGKGYTGVLRECRHTYWGDDGKGYIYYPESKVIRAILDELEIYFDMD